MHIARTATTLTILLLVWAPSLLAGSFSHAADFMLVSLWGETTYEISFPEGSSRLQWPMDMHAAGMAYRFNCHDTLEVDLSLIASPRRESGDAMKDYDWINESFYPGRDPHEGVDVFSASDVDSRIFMANARSRLFLLSYTPVSLALSAGYTYQEIDYRTYNTVQVGYGSWQDQSARVSGPTTTYALEVKALAVGMSCRVNLDNALVITIDASLLPYVQADDEDNHIRRSRVSQSECTGTGTEVSISTRFNVYRNWDLFTHCTRYRMATSGDQTQYWYGDDPATLNYDDTGSVLNDIDVDIDQETFQVDLGIGCRF